MLRWFGYFTEEVPDSRIENCRIRKVVIRFYLDNDTLDVLEPRQTNSGIDQVCAVPGHLHLLLCAHCNAPAAACYLSGDQSSCQAAQRCRRASCTGATRS